MHCTRFHLERPEKKGTGPLKQRSSPLFFRTLLQAGYCSLLVVVLNSSAPAGDGDLAIQAQAILKAQCYRCHGAEAKAKGGFHYVLDRDQLVARNKVVPGSAEKSELYQRIVKTEMPPKNSPTRPSAADVAVL